MSDIKTEKIGRAAWQSPSNIALIKYWGKKGFQIPANASVSMTLSEATTQTIVDYRPANEPGQISFDFLFDGKPNPAFATKLKGYFETIVPELPFLTHYHFEIHSSNSFPHSAGIASSASAMSALALCLCSIEQQISNDMEAEDAAFFVKASHLARIGSGSAARSVYGGFVSWGKTPSITDSADEYATPLNKEIHPVFQHLKDSILIISKGEKKVSSRAGHGLMVRHPYAKARYIHAEKNLELLLQTLKTGNLNDFTAIVENEALTLHAMMMASNPGFLLTETGTLQVIGRISQFRLNTGIPVCFTLDAGPNVHLLYPEKDEIAVNAFIERELLVFCENDRMIDDKMGIGPKKL
ncbi:MAG: diphosphomevalonate decarboxylase [Bacteroidales bacterium]|nr:diphosphomevalonate decarboxylase [Bacteroidales bacterium]